MHTGYCTIQNCCAGEVSHAWQCLVTVLTDAFMKRPSIWVVGGGYVTSVAHSSSTWANCSNIIWNTAQFKCNTCTRWFKHNAELNDHKKSHSDVQIHCEFSGCTYFTHLKKRLTDHIAVHLDSDQKRYSCKQCGKKYNYQSSLSIHKKICGKDTSVTSSLAT